MIIEEPKINGNLMIDSVINWKYKPCHNTCPKCSTTNTRATAIQPAIQTVPRMIILVEVSVIFSPYEDGNTKSSSTTAANAFKAVDKELQVKRLL